jgi:hypothetical protein
MRITETTISSDPMPIASAASQASTIAFPPSSNPFPISETPSISSTESASIFRSVSPPFSLTSTPTSTGISAETLQEDVAKACGKGYRDRLAEWINLTNEAYPLETFSQANPKSLPNIYSLRIISFMYIEVMHVIEVTESKQADYVNQLHRLSHAPISDTYRRVADIQMAITMDLVDMAEILVQQQQETTQERRQHLQRIVKGGKAQLAKLHALTVRLQRHLPQYGNQILYPVDVFTKASTSGFRQEAPLISPVPVQSKKRSTMSTPPGLTRNDLTVSSVVSFGGGGGGSLSWDEQQRVPEADASSPVHVPPSRSYSSYRSVSPVPVPPSSRSTSPDIPPPPSLTVPSSSPSPEAYPTSTSQDHTSTLIVTNPLTLSGTFSLTLTPNNFTNVTLSQPLSQHNSGSPPDEDPYAYPFMGGDPDGALRLGFHSGDDGRTDYQLGLTDTPDSDSEDQDDCTNYSADDSDPLRYSDYQLGLTDIPDYISTESEEHNSGSPPVSPRSPSPEPQYGSWEEHSQWLADGCPPEYDGSDSDSHPSHCSS